MEDLIVEMLQEQQIMAVQLIREYLYFIFWSAIYYAYLRHNHECKYCYTDLQ